MRRYQLILAAIGVLVLPVAAAHASTIIQDTFTNSAGAVNGRAVETPQKPGDKWASILGGTANVGSDVLTFQGLVPNNHYSKAYAPISPSLLPAGTQTYTLSYELAIPTTTDAHTITFFTGYNEGGKVDTDAAPLIQFSGNMSTGTSLTLYAGVANSGPTSKLYSAAVTRASSDDPYSANVAIQINPNLATNNVEFFINGTDLGSGTYTGPIAYLWYDLQGSYGATVTVDNVLVTDAVPEPASLSLLLIGGIPMLLRRRQAIVD